MEQPFDYTQLTTFAAICAAQGKDENDYDTAKATTNKQLADLYKDRTQLIAKAVNGPVKINIADTDQYKYGLWCWVNPCEVDEKHPAGCRLSFCGCGFDLTVANLGARPLFVDEERGQFAFETFQEEFELQLNYEALALME